MPTSAAILRRARESAGLTQSELAERSGIPQSSISAYERGRHTPSLEALRRLVDASGRKLELGLGAESLSGTGATATSTLEAVRSHSAALHEVARSFGVSKIHVFGSVARGEDGPDSDVDLLVELDGPIGLIGLARIEAALGKILGRRVEVLPRFALSQESVDSLMRDAVPL